MSRQPVKSAIRTQPIEIANIQKDRAYQVKIAAEGLRDLIAGLAAMGTLGPARARAFSIAITSVEQAAFWAVNGITDDDDDDFVDLLKNAKPVSDFVSRLRGMAEEFGKRK